jgi:F-type H+-transporting ATPase subunit b
MPDLVHQLGELFLGAVPVALIVVVLYLILRSLFFQPLLKVMAERDARTSGAQKAAEAALAAAAEKIRQYEEAQKQARAKVYAEQEANRKKFMEERVALLKEARAKGTVEVNAAKEVLSKEFGVAKKELQGTAAQLSAEIARRVFEAHAAPGGSANEAQ